MPGESARLRVARRWEQSSAHPLPRLRHRHACSSRGVHWAEVRSAPAALRPPGSSSLALRPQGDVAPCPFSPAAPLPDISARSQGHMPCAPPLLNIPCFSLLPHVRQASAPASRAMPCASRPLRRASLRWPPARTSASSATAASTCCRCAAGRPHARQRRQHGLVGAAHGRHAGSAAALLLACALKLSKPRPLCGVPRRGEGGAASGPPVTQLPPHAGVLAHCRSQLYWLINLVD